MEARNAESRSPLCRGNEPLCRTKGRENRIRDSARTTDKPTRMKVTEKDVSYVADLANLELSGDEQIAMVRDLNSILGYIDRLNELDTSNVEPMAQVSDRYGVDQSKQGSERFAYASREDILEGLRKSRPHEEALANAPDADDNFFRVPKVIER